MSKFVILRNNDTGKPEFLREFSGDDSYTDDLALALTFGNEKNAGRELIDDEVVAELEFDAEGDVIGYHTLEIEEGDNQ